jgi:hypothetical protein
MISSGTPFAKLTPASLNSFLVIVFFELLSSDLLSTANPGWPHIHWAIIERVLLVGLDGNGLVTGGTATLFDGDSASPADDDAATRLERR